jgi:hypothetical protein
MSVVKIYSKNEIEHKNPKMQQYRALMATLTRVLLNRQDISEQQVSC